MRVTPAVAMASVAALLAAAPAGAGTGGAPTLVELQPQARCTEALTIARAGGRLVAAELGLYLVPAAVAARIVPLLRARGALPLQHARSAGRHGFGRGLLRPARRNRVVARRYRRRRPHAAAARTARHDRRLRPRPQRIRSSRAAPTRSRLNPQELPGTGGKTRHLGRIRARGAQNGVGLVGIYPDAVLRSWDAGERGRRRSRDLADRGGDPCGREGGPGVVNLSFVSRSRTWRSAGGLGSRRQGHVGRRRLGQRRERRNPPRYPAATTHVLTVGATDTSNSVARSRGAHDTSTSSPQGSAFRSRSTEPGRSWTGRASRHLSSRAPVRGSGRLDPSSTPRSCSK